MSQLSQMNCKPCEKGTPPLKGAAAAELLRQLRGWEIVGEQRLSKLYTFPNFVTALAFTNQVGDLAEVEGHHPDIYLTWGKVRIELWTHSIGGLSQSDFVLAAKIDELSR